MGICNKIHEPYYPLEPIEELGLDTHKVGILEEPSGGAGSGIGQAVAVSLDVLRLCSRAEDRVR